MKFLLPILLIAYGAAYAAAPSVTCTNSASSGVAPLSVHRDCTATTGVTFHTGDFFHNFGDTSAGNWSQGSNTNARKSMVIGAIAAHVYETPGTYTVSTRVCNSSNECATDTDTVTVSNPNTVYASTATVCVNTTAPVAGADGCPSGAAVVTSSDFCSAVGSNIGTTKRVLFRRGVTFACATKVTITADGPWTIGAYGAGSSRAVVSTSQTSGIIIEIGAGAGVLPNDGRIMDLEFTQSAGTATASIRGVGNFDQLLLMNLYIHDIGDGPQFLANSLDVVGNSIANVYNYLTIYDCTISNINGGSGTHGIYVMANYFAILGNLIDDTLDAEHLLRVSYGLKAVIQNNTLRNGAASKETMALRGVQQDSGGAGYLSNILPAPSPTQYLIVSGNSVEVLRPEGVKVAPASSTIVNSLLDFITERNYYHAPAGSTGNFGLLTQATRHTSRNEVFNFTNWAFYVGVIALPATTGTGAAADISIFNNTYYSAGNSNSGNATMTQAQAGVTNFAMINNLGYVPAISGTATVFSDNCTACETLSNNSSAGQMTGTNPFETTPSSELSTFRPSIAGYAATGGTAIFPASNDDFFNCDDVTANEHIGAMVPRARATCRGVK